MMRSASRMASPHWYYHYYIYYYIYYTSLQWAGDHTCDTIDASTMMIILSMGYGWHMMNMLLYNSYTTTNWCEMVSMHGRMVRRTSYVDCWCWMSWCQQVSNICISYINMIFISSLKVCWITNLSLHKDHHQLALMHLGYTIDGYVTCLSPIVR